MCLAARRKLQITRRLTVGQPTEVDGYVFPMFIDNSIVSWAALVQDEARSTIVTEM